MFASMLACGVLCVIGEIRTLEFQQGVDGYRSTIDTTLYAKRWNVRQDSDTNLTIDLDRAGGYESQAVIQFQDIFGSQPNQIPMGSRIVSAKLVLTCHDPGGEMRVHQVLIPWDGSATWESTKDGLTHYANEIKKEPDFVLLTGDLNGQDFKPFELDVAKTLRAWANGEPNYGWALMPESINAWTFYSSVVETVEHRPKLVVEFEPIDP